MRFILCGLAFLTTLAMAAPVEDDLDRLLKERGLVTQMTDQLTQQISNQFNGPLQSARNTFGGKASELVIQAMGLLGVPYLSGGTSEEKALIAAASCATCMKSLSAWYCPEGLRNKPKPQKKSSAVS